MTANDDPNAAYAISLIGVKSLKELSWSEQGAPWKEGVRKMVHAEQLGPRGLHGAGVGGLED